MRKLTQPERIYKANAYDQWQPKVYTFMGAFEVGFTAGLDYQQRKLDAYAAYVAGKITLAELEEVINQ